MTCFLPGPSPPPKKRPRKFPPKKGKTKKKTIPTKISEKNTKTAACAKNRFCGVRFRGPTRPRSSTKLPRSFHETLPDPPRSSTKLPRNFHEGQGWTEQGAHENLRLWGIFRGKTLFFCFFWVFFIFFKKFDRTAPKTDKSRRKHQELTRRASRTSQVFGSSFSCKQFSRQKVLGPRLSQHFSVTAGARCIQFLLKAHAFITEVDSLSDATSRLAAATTKSWHPTDATACLLALEDLG